MTIYSSIVFTFIYSDVASESDAHKKFLLFIILIPIFVCIFQDFSK